MLYTIKVKYKDFSETIEFQTDNLEWTMDQYQRNRDMFDYEVIKVVKNWDLKE